jgi:hypothetical protein
VPVVVVMLASEADNLRRGDVVRGPNGGKNGMALTPKANNPARGGVVRCLRRFRALRVGHGREGTAVKLCRDGVGVDEALMVLCEGGTLVEDYSDWAGFSFVDGSVDVRVLGLAGRVRNGDEGKR